MSAHDHVLQLMILFIWCIQYNVLLLHQRIKFDDIKLNNHVNNTDITRNNIIIIICANDITGNCINNAMTFTTMRAI